jgi:flagellar secretion chaperone FliS
MSSTRHLETLITASSPEPRVAIGCEGAICHLKPAVMDIEVRDLSGKGRSIDQALTIVQHFQTTLDMERGGTIAGCLDWLYTYGISRILHDSNYLKTEPLKEVVKLLVTFLGSREAVAGQSPRQRPTVVATAMVCYAKGMP